MTSDPINQKNHRGGFASSLRNKGELMCEARCLTIMRHKRVTHHSRQFIVLYVVNWHKRLSLCLTGELSLTLKMRRKLVLCLTVAFNLPHKWLKIPLANSTPHQALRHETLKKSHLYNTGESSLMHASQGVIIPKCMSQNDFYIFFFSKQGYFAPFFLSAAACGGGLVVSIWWCNAVTVLLQSSRKASATAFRPTPASNKDTYTTQQRCGHRSLSGLTERRQAEAKGGELKCHVLLMKYRTVLCAGSGVGPKLI